MAEMGGDLPTAGEGYDQSIWMLEVLLDDIAHGDTQAREDDRASIEMSKSTDPYGSKKADSA